MGNFWGGGACALPPFFLKHPIIVVNESTVCYGGQLWLISDGDVVLFI